MTWKNRKKVARGNVRNSKMKVRRDDVTRDMEEIENISKILYQ